MATTRPMGSHETRGGRIEEAVGHGGGRARLYGVRDVGRRRGGRAGAQGGDQGHPAAQVGDAGPVRGLLRGAREGLLRQGRARRLDQGRRPEHHARDGRRGQSRGVRPRLATEPLRHAREGLEARLRRPGVRTVGNDRADLEVERDQHDQEDARQEGRGLVLRERARALCGAPEERHRPLELESRDDRQPAVRHAAVLEEPGRRGGGDDLQRARAGARDEEPEDRKALHAEGPERLQDVRPERRHRHARGQRLRARGLAQGQGQPGHHGEVPEGLVRGLDLLPRPPGGVREHRPEERVAARPRPPDVADERDQRAHLAELTGHRAAADRLARADDEDREELRRHQEPPEGCDELRVRRQGGRAVEEGEGERHGRLLEEGDRQGHGGREVERPEGRSTMSVLIKGGRIVTAADDYVGDVFVDGERISLLGESLDVTADTLIDATGKLVLPGLVDPHTHLDMPFGGTTTIDDVTSGHTAAAFGGTTCHVDFCIQGAGQSFADALSDWHAKRDGKAIIDMGYHIAVTDLSAPGRLDELATLPDQGVTSYKLFMAYKGALMVDDETLFRTMEVAARTGALVMVHAENGDAIDVLVKEALAAGNTAPVYHALTRPPETEGEATNRAIQLARVAGCPLYVAHVSCKESVEPITLAREKGWDVWGETCTQYFFVDTTFLERPDFEGAKYVYTPPPREKANQDVLWNAVRTDVLSAISTDHCAFLWDGQKSLGKDDFSKIPNGGPGLENRLHMIHHFGVVEGRITLNRMVELLATNPAKLFGLYPRKGTVAVGSDADLVVFDPKKQVTISASTHHSKADYSLYEGTVVTGAPDVVLLRGNVLVENDEL